MTTTNNATLYRTSKTLFGRILLVSALLVLALGISVRSADAAPVTLTDVFNSGVDSSGLVLTPGTTDPHYTITATPGGPFGLALVQLNHPAWSLNDTVGTPGSSWISTVAAGATNIAPGTYTFETTFNLTGLGAAELTLSLASDNSVTVDLNSNPTGISQAGFGGFGGPFTINSGFVAGLNTLEFHLFNSPGTTGNPNPGGLRIELSGTAAVIPEPSTFALAGLGMLSLALVGWRRRCRTT